MKNLVNKLRNSKIFMGIIFALTSLVLVFCIIIGILLCVGKNSLLENDGKIEVPQDYTDFIENDGKTIIYKGQKYKYNEQITSLLVMGIDRENLSGDLTETHGKNGQADVLLLMALDTSNGKLKTISVSRDTMVDINLYSENGQYLGVSKKQICLSYAYGDGRETSCDNTVTAVSRLLYGIPINSYVAIDIEGIKVLNDALGGVTLTVDEDIDLYDKHLKKGDRVTLKGSYALRYLRMRDKHDVTANNARMKRQKNYLKSFFKTALDKTKKDISTPVKLYNKISQYKVSDLTVADITYLTQCVLLNRNNDGLNFVSIAGKTTAGEKYAEFYPDEEKLYETIIEVFYIPIQD